MKSNVSQNSSDFFKEQGSIYLYNKQYPEAIEYFQKELKILNELSAINLLRVAECHKHLGRAWKGNENYENSILSFEKSLEKYEELCKKVIVNYNENTARIYHELANTYLLTENYAKAQESYNEAIEKWNIAPYYLPPQYKLPEIALNYNNLGNIFYLEKKYSEAVENYLQALSLFKEAYGNDANHLDIAKCYTNLGIVLGAGKNFQESVDYFNKATKIVEVHYAVFPDDYYELNVQAYNKLKTAYEAVGCKEQAQECSDKIKLIEGKLKFGNQSSRDVDEVPIDSAVPNKELEAGCDLVELSGQNENAEDL